MVIHVYCLKQAAKAPRGSPPLERNFACNVESATFIHETDEFAFNLRCMSWEPTESLKALRMQISLIFLAIVVGWLGETHWQNSELLSCIEALEFEFGLWLGSRIRSRSKSQVKFVTLMPRGLNWRPRLHSEIRLLEGFVYNLQNSFRPLRFDNSMGLTLNEIWYVASYLVRNSGQVASRIRFFQLSDQFG